LFFQSRGQLIFLGKPWGKIALVLGIPPTNGFTVTILIVFTLVVIVSLLVVPLSVPISVTLG